MRDNSEDGEQSGPIGISSAGEDLRGELALAGIGLAWVVANPDKAVQLGKPGIDYIRRMREAPLATTVKTLSVSGENNATIATLSLGNLHEHCIFIDSIQVDSGGGVDKFSICLHKKRDMSFGSSEDVENEESSLVNCTIVIDALSKRDVDIVISHSVQAGRRAVKVVLKFGYYLGDQGILKYHSQKVVLLR